MASAATTELTMNQPRELITAITTVRIALPLTPKASRSSVIRGTRRRMPLAVSTP